MLSTSWSRSFGLRVPIVNAPMGGVAGGRLAAAVTAAGGLGMVGMGSVATRELLQTQLQHVHGTFGIGLVDWVMRNEAGLPSRVLANDFVARWTGKEDVLDRSACDELAAATAADDRRIAPVDAGQSVGMISDDASVGEVIEQMCAGAESLLAGWGS